MYPDMVGFNYRYDKKARVLLFTLPASSGPGIAHQSWKSNAEPVPGRYVCQAIPARMQKQPDAKRQDGRTSLLNHHSDTNFPGLN